MKLLAVCDSPTMQTGFARVAQNLLRRWAPHFERIDVWAIGYNGYPGKPGVESGWLQKPYRLYPANYSTPWYEADRLQSLMNHIDQGDYTHIWFLQDHFLLVRAGFCEALREVCHKHGIKSYYYCPVDAQMEPPWSEICLSVDYPVAYTDYGRMEIQRCAQSIVAPGTPLDNIRIIPHGVDTAVYRPLPDKQELRKKLTGGWPDDDETLLINVNANQRRKDPVASLQVLHAIHQRGHRQVKLLMHMAETGPDDLSLEAAGRQLGLVYGKDWRHTGKTFLKSQATLPESVLVELYNTANMYLTTSLGEGWGLGITEALACGLPVMIPEHTACLSIAQKLSEIWPGAPVELMPVQDYGIMCWLDNGRIRPRVDIKCAARKTILACMRHHGKTYQMNDQTKEWLSWDRIAQEWLDLFALPERGVMKAFKGKDSP